MLYGLVWDMAFYGFLLYGIKLTHALAGAQCLRALTDI
jgi:hypothetical protein